MFGYFDESAKFADSDFAMHMRNLIPLRGPFERWDRERAIKALSDFIGLYNSTLLGAYYPIAIGQAWSCDPNIMGASLITLIWTS
jgi:hypothetical protein